MKSPKTILRMRLEMESAMDAIKSITMAMTCDDDLYEEHLNIAAAQMESAAKRIRQIANDKQST